jgi:hypothetical protein
MCSKKMKKAIVTIAVGERYFKMFHCICQNNWMEYCDRFGYDLIVIEDKMDTSDRANSRSVAWQKLLILSQDWSSEYDRIVWVDVDVIMNSKYAYDICDGVPIEKVGAVDSYSIPTREIHRIALSRLYDRWRSSSTPFIDNLLPNQYYTNRGINGGHLNSVVQTGVMVCSPIHHRDIFENVYYGYEDEHGAEWNYEMPALSFELLQADLVHWISPRFNFTVGDIEAAFYQSSRESHLKDIYDLSIFMHFAGCAHKMPLATQFI